MRGIFPVLRDQLTGEKPEVVTVGCMGPLTSARGVRSSASHSFDEARITAYSLGAARRTPTVEVSLTEAIGRALAGDMRARTDLPVEATSAVDGWAVAGDGPWRIIDSQPAPAELVDGTAVPVAAGAALPPGARAVLRRKDARLDRDILETQRIPSGRDVRPAGEECVAGSVLLAAGTMLSPPMVGLAAAAGWESLRVARRPDVEILFLRGAASQRAPSAAEPDALAPQLPAWVSSYGGYLIGGVRRCESSSATVRALQCQADVTMIVASNAASGREELSGVLQDAQAELVIDGVAVRPGHPVTMALLPTGRVAIGLPNTPQSALLGVITLLGPVLAGMQGRVIGPLTTGRLDQAIPGRGSDTVLRPVTRTMTPGVYSPVDYVGAGMLRGFALADGVAVVPSGGRHAGSVVDILALPWTTVC